MTNFPLPDNIPPTVSSITRLNPSQETTDADSLAFCGVFSESVTNVDKADFVVTGGSTAGVASVSGSGTTYSVTVSGGDLASFNGTVGLGFAAEQNIADSSSNALVNTTPAGANQAYTLANNRFVTLVVKSPANDTFSFASAEAALNVDVVSIGGNGTSGAISVPPGSHAISFTPPAGVGIQSVSCSGTRTLDPVT